MKKINLVFFTNDFGFGPTSRTHTIASLLHHRLGDGIDITLITDGRYDYLYKYSPIRFDNVKSLRDERLIFEKLKGYRQENTLILSTMNRFALKAAKKLSLKSILFDGLYWFWPSRPTEYQIADLQICFVLPWQLNNAEPNTKVKLFAGPVEIIEFKNKKMENNNKELISLNGFITPFYEPSHDVYLELINKFVSGRSKKTEVLLTVNRNIVNKINDFTQKNIIIKTLTKTEFIQSMVSCDHVLLNGGSNSFLEALYYETKFLFYLPSNLSQYALINEVAKATNKKIEFWCPLLSLMENHNEILNIQQESDAINFLSNKVNKLLSDKNYKYKLSNISEQIDKNLDEIDNITKVKELRQSSQNSKKSLDLIVTAVSNFIAENY